jgi:hypothetical protein
VSCPHASEVITTIIGSEAWLKLPETTPWRIKGFAATIIHEYAHNVDVRAHARAGRPAFPAPSGMLSEAWASLAEETATRFAIGRPTDAFNYLIGEYVPDNGSGLLGMWGVYSGSSPWLPDGAYTLATQMLLFARERAGEASIEHNRRPTFYQRLNANAPNPADRVAHARALAQVAGMTLDSLVDMQALAGATAGLLDSYVYQTQPLPRFQSWNMSDVAQQDGPFANSFPLRVPRVGRQDIELTAGAGGFAAAYLMADAGRGLSLRFDYIGPYRKVVRVTRVR